MRFHVNYNGSKIYLGFYAKNYRFVFYTHGKIYSVNDWKNFVRDFKLTIYDEAENELDWDQFMTFVDYLQYNSNAKWANKYFMSKTGYNFSDNKSAAVAA